MSLLNKEIENTIVAIGDSLNGVERWFGTGFFVRKKAPDNGSYVYLISNKHVLMNREKINIRVVLKNNKVTTISVPLIINGKSLLSIHYNNNIDIAAVLLNGQFIDEQMEIIYTFDLDDDSFSSDEYVDNGGFEGSPIFMLGFPLGFIDEYSTTPICRMGCIARFKLDEIKNKFNFILDLQNFPGNSGSPIICCPENIGLQGTKMINKAALIGIIHSYIPYNEYLINSQTNHVAEIKTENSGLALAHPVEYIRDIVVNDLLKKGFIGKN